MKNKEFEKIVAEYAYRQTGRTTRIIDNLVQELFEHGIVYVRDHGYWHNNGKINLYCLCKFCDRLSQEHPQIKFKVNRESYLNLYVEIDAPLTDKQEHERFVYLHNNKMFRNEQDSQGWRKIEE